MPWFKVTLPDNSVERGAQREFQAEFEAVFMAANVPRDMALFTPFGLSNDFYLSPGSEPHTGELRAKYDAVECSPPSGRLTLLVGHDGALDMIRDAEA